jgi:hypothetical protein
MQTYARLTLDAHGFAFDPVTGSSYTLNATAMACLDALRAGADDGTIAVLLADAYDVAPARAQRDVLDFLADLRRFGLG